MGTRSKLTLAWLALTLSVTACEDSKGEEAPPTRPDGGGLTDEEDADVEEDSGEPTGDAGTEPGDGGANCRGKDGCYSCTPTTNLELLNSCAEGCRKFDDKSYPTSWKPGQTLPALP